MNAEGQPGWQPTKHGGLRRLGVAQGQSTAVTRRRSVVRFSPPGLGEIRLSWSERLGLPACPYLVRWAVETKIGSIRVHSWHGPDDDRAFHDHPWWFLTFVIKGGYVDKNPNGDEHLHAPAIKFRPALHRHTVVPDPGGAVTLLITGPKIRSWGFWFNGKFRKANKWFAGHGHHPCT